MKEQKNSLMSTVAAVKELRRVPGFDPMKFVRTASSQTGEKVLKLDLRYKRLWFRLACPNGRMVLNRLRITDQMAIFEALVYAGKDDASPLASFTSSRTADDAPGGRYIQAAQDEALNEALDNAGFGIQLCDVTQTSDRSGLGSEIPLSQVEAVQKASAEVKQAEAGHGETSTSTDSSASSVPASTPIKSEEGQNAPSSSGSTAPLGATTATSIQGQAETPFEDDATTQTSIQQTGTTGGVSDVQTAPQEPQAETTGTAEETTPSSGHTANYSEDMSVEDICGLMTLDEAHSLVVPEGTCEGWTLAQVAERRPSSLKWLLFSCKKANNVLKAGATLVFNDFQAKKAG